MSSGRRERDEELLLFKELFRRDEEQNVTLQLVTDDFDASPVAQDKSAYIWTPKLRSCGKIGLKTPPPTPLFPSLEMESIDSKFLSYKDPFYIKPLRTSRLAKIQVGPKPIQRPKSPSPRSTTSSSPATAAAAITLGDALNIKRRPKQTRFTTTKPSTTTTVAAVSDTKSHTRVITGEAVAPEIPTTEARNMPRRWRRSTELPETPATAASSRPNLVLGSRMVEKMMNARRSAAAPESELMTRSSLGHAFRHMELRKGGSEQQQKNSVSSKPVPEAASGDGDRVGFRRRSIDKNGGVRHWFENLVN